MSKARDMKPRSAVQGLAAWIGKGSGAIVVMVLRAEDHVFWVDPQCPPTDAADVVQSCLGAMIAETTAEREAERREKETKRQQALLSELRRRKK